MAGARDLREVPGAGHGEALGKAWGVVEAWIMKLASLQGGT